MNVVVFPNLTARQQQVLAMLLERNGRNIHKMPVEFQQRVDELDQLKVVCREGAVWTLTPIGEKVARRNL